jgi:hypothetical protein
VSKINPDSISIPSSLRVFPTSTWATTDYVVPREFEHLKSATTCPVCSGWQSVEDITVYRPHAGPIIRTILRCHSPKDRYLQRCAPQILSERPVDEYPSQADE